MTLISLAQAARQLGIDVKTLHHWLALAHLPLATSAQDARLKGLNPSQLEDLARIHQRRLLTQATPQPPTPLHPTGLPPDLLALLEPLAQLPNQLAAFHEQVAALAQRLPAATADTSEPQTGADLTAPIAPKAAPLPAPTPKAAPPAPVLARVQYVGNGRYEVLCPTHGVLPLEPDSREWVGWLMGQTAFRFVGQHGRLTAHREVDRLHPRPWRAHRKLRNHTHNLPLAHTHDLTIAVLEQAAATFQARLG